jgi:Amt family ammonium transporter
MMFRGMFFIFTPALICGAFAERMKFSALVAFMVLWGTFVYCPLCHWVWDGGLLSFVKTGETGKRRTTGDSVHFGRNRASEKHRSRSGRGRS